MSQIFRVLAALEPPPPFQIGGKGDPEGSKFRFFSLIILIS